MLDLPPRIQEELLPPQEQKAAGHLWVLFGALESCIANFQDAVTLFDFFLPICADIERRRNEAIRADDTPVWSDFQKQDQMIRWMGIAGRDAAMTIYNFGEALKAIDGRVRECPTLFGWIDVVQWEETLAAWKLAFPRPWRMRNAVGHATEEIETSKKFEANLVKPGNDIPGVTVAEGGGLFVGCVTDGRKITMPNKGGMVSITVNEDNAKELKRIKLMTYSAFRHAEMKMETLGRELRAKG